MVTITRASRKAVREFNKREWQAVIFELYGREVEWNEKKFVFKAELEGEIVGAMVGKHESGVVYVEQMIVASDKRRQGIGRALMEKAEEFGKRYGAHKIHLITGEGWPANAFYEKLGFTREACLPKHHFKRDFVIYSKFIDL